MIGNIKKLLHDNKKDFSGGGGMKWLNISHDMWSTLIMDGAMGSSIKLITQKMVPVTIATGLVKSNGSHRAADCATDLEELFLNRYDIVVKDEVVSAGRHRKCSSSSFYSS